MSGGYDISQEVDLLKRRFPLSYASSKEPEEAEPEADANDGPGVYVVTQTASGRTARIQGDSRQDIIHVRSKHSPAFDLVSYNLWSSVH
jgi:hypothetical protein